MAKKTTNQKLREAQSDQEETPADGQQNVSIQGVTAKAGANG